MDVVIVNEQDLKSKIKAFKDGGKNKLHVLSDFDGTLTKVYVNGKKVPSIISILRDEDYLVEGYADKAKVLFAKYHPMEISHDLTLNEKRNAMGNWWTEHNELLIDSKLNLNDVKKAIKSDNLQFREGSLDFMKSLNEYGIPLVILSSAGLGQESISLLLERDNAKYDNVNIVSNQFEWNGEGYAVDYKKPVITVFAKKEVTLQGLSIFYELEKRKNVVLLGNSLGDSEMIDGFEYDHLISIGFLDSDEEKDMEAFKKVYDVVITNDGDFTYINSLLKEILNLKP